MMCTTLPGMDQFAFFSVLDGHAGKVTALYSAQHLLSSVIYEVLPARDSLNGIREGMRRGFLRHDRNLQSNFEVLRDRSGSTCTSVLITPTHYVFCNLGDSRTVLAHGSKVVYGTKDHKPSLPTERARIKNAGGMVINDRVDGGLAVARAFGDFDYKMRTDLPPTKQRVSPEPETHAVPRTTHTDEFLILACDGIWDVMSNQVAVKFVHSQLKTPGTTLGDVCERMIRRCLQLGSRDNMSVMIIVPEPPAPVTTGPLTREQIAHKIAASAAYNIITSAIATVVGEKGTSVVNTGELVCKYIHHPRRDSISLQSPRGSGTLLSDRVTPQVCCIKIRYLFTSLHCIVLHCIVVIYTIIYRVAGIFCYI